jgi:hypothetical protein
LQDAGILQLALKKCVVLVARSPMASMPLSIKTARVVVLVVGILLAFNVSSLYRLDEASMLLLLFSLAFVTLTAAVLACALLYLWRKGLIARGDHGIEISAQSSRQFF